MTDSRISHLLALRQRFQQVGDRGLLSEVNAELARLGHIEQETTRAAAMPEAAVPDKPRRRPAKP
jgi:hypothetical protein